MKTMLAVAAGMGCMALSAVQIDGNWKIVKPDIGESVVKGDNGYELAFWNPNLESGSFVNPEAMGELRFE